MLERGKPQFVAIFIATAAVLVIDISGYVLFKMTPYGTGDAGGFSVLGVVAGVVGLAVYYQLSRRLRD